MRYFNSIEVLEVRVNGSGWVSWVSKAGWLTVDLKDFKPRQKPLVAPLQNGHLLVYGGVDFSEDLFDGIFFDVETKAVTHEFD